MSRRVQAVSCARLASPKKNTRLGSWSPGAAAAVTAHLADDKQLVCDCVNDLIRNPVEAAAGLTVLITACGALAELWGRAIHEDSAKAWEMYAAAVARGISNLDAYRSARGGYSWRTPQSN
jgi:hypothetical protein